jgi:hypothetical protein
MEPSCKPVSISNGPMAPPRPFEGYLHCILCIGRFAADQHCDSQEALIVGGDEILKERCIVGADRPGAGPFDHHTILTPQRRHSGQPSLDTPRLETGWPFRPAN